MNFRIINQLFPKTENRSLLINSFIVISASMLGNVFSYLFQLLAGKYLSKPDFAELASLFALSGIISLIAMFFTNGIVKIISEFDHNHSDYKHNVSVFFYSVFKVNLIILSLITLSLALFSGLITAYLNLEDINIFYMFIFAVATSVLIAQVSPFLQGFQKFKELSAFTFLTALTKFSVIVVVMYMGLRLIDIFLGLALTTIIMALIGLYFLKSNIDSKIFHFNKLTIKKLFNYSIGAFFTVLGINLIQNVDIILVKHFFITDLASSYSSLSIIGKIIFYAASPIGIIMLPICAKQFFEHSNLETKSFPKYIKTFIFALIMTALIAGFIGITFIIFPQFIIKLLFGTKYIESASYLPLYAVMIFVHSFVNLFSLFYIAISKFKIAALVLVGSLIQFAGINLTHGSLSEVIYICLMANSIVCIIYTFFFFKIRKEHI